jgi:dolichol-phosphate mannosyltransferase
LKILIIIPTFNESENIGKLLPEVLDKDERVDILIVDDNSPDGTADIVKSMIQSEPRIHIIEREGKLGLGTAYVAGFKYALENDYDAVMEMDADFSHDPKEIPNFIRQMDKYDFIQGSRYIQGVNVINWPMHRLLLSYFANYYIRIITGMPVRDGTGGYRLIKREVLESIDLSKIKSNGYSFQVELIFKAYKKKFKIKEIPIIFMDRVQGKSKMSKKIIREAIFMVWVLRLKSILKIL